MWFKVAIKIAARTDESAEIWQLGLPTSSRSSHANTGCNAHCHPPCSFLSSHVNTLPMWHCKSSYILQFLTWLRQKQPFRFVVFSSRWVTAMSSMFSDTIHASVQNRKPEIYLSVLHGRGNISVWNLIQTHQLAQWIYDFQWPETVLVHTPNTESYCYPAPFPFHKKTHLEISVSSAALKSAP